MNPDVYQIPATLALAIMALLGYVFGVLPQRNRRALLGIQRELARAQMAVRELEKVVSAAHNSTAKHYALLKGFKSRIARLRNPDKDAFWHEVCGEVERILNPTLQLVGEIAAAQEHIRYQSTHLMRFSEMRTDPLTGLGNRRALDSMLATQFALLKRYGTFFSLAIVDIDHFKDLNDEQGHLYGDEMLRNLSASLTDMLRDVDILARYGGDEFVVVMPQTELTGASALAERLRMKVEQGMPFTVTIGVASADSADTPESLFQRADVALYRAKSSGRNCTCCHHGETMETVNDIESAAQSNSDVRPCKGTEREIDDADTLLALIDEVPQIVDV
jgi:diguanylate cyclase (GGDEF)-like protein